MITTQYDPATDAEPTEFPLEFEQPTHPDDEQPQPPQADRDEEAMRRLRTPFDVTM